MATKSTAGKKETKKNSVKQTRSQKGKAENSMDAENVQATDVLSEDIKENTTKENTTVEQKEESHTVNEGNDTVADTKDEIPNQQVILNEHSEEVCSMFKKITKHYDLLNHVCSLGLDYWWRHVLVSGFVLGSTNKILDMAAGTLDVSLCALKKYKQAQIVAGDICPEMLEMGKEKLKAADVDRIELKTIDALAVPYAEKSFDVVSMAFGIRNIDERVKALAELKKVLVTGGQLYILEFSPVKNPLLQKAYYFYIEKIMPAIARLFGENAEAYEYLAKSIKAFPRQEDFCAELKEAGFDFVNYKKLSFGIVTIYTAIKGK